MTQLATYTQKVRMVYCVRTVQPEAYSSPFPFPGLCMSLSLSPSLSGVCVCVSECLRFGPLWVQVGELQESLRQMRVSKDVAEQRAGTQLAPSAT